MVDQTVRRVADESSVSVVMDRRCSARGVKRTRDPGPERLGKENAPAAAGASAPQGARFIPARSFSGKTHTSLVTRARQPVLLRHPGLADPFGFPGGESKVAIGRFVLNKRNHGFESIPLHHSVVETRSASRRVTIPATTTDCSLVLNELKYETGGLRSKDWNEFAQPDSPPLDFVFTLCDRAAAEVCPTWPGQPIRAHWGIQDPVAVVGTSAAARKAFLKVYTELEQRIRIFTALPIETLERFALERWVTEIGKLNLAA